MTDSPESLVRENINSSIESKKEKIEKINLKILLVEDTPVNQKVLNSQLKTLGMEADCVFNGAQALDRLDQMDYDIIFMDCIMPILDGYKTAKTLREREGETRHTIVIAMTANTLKGEREKCLAAGMDDYISKPVEIETLTALLQRWTSILAAQRKIDCKDCISTAIQKPKENCFPTPKPLEARDLVNENISMLVDLHRLSVLAGGNPEFELELLATFSKDAQCHLELAELALKAWDFDTLFYRAHQLKGSGKMVGVRYLPELAEMLEYVAKEKQFNEAEKLITQLKEILNQISDKMSNLNLRGNN